MVATILIQQHTGAASGGDGGTNRDDVTQGNLRMSTSDVNDPGTDDPIPTPDTGSNYSFWVSTRLNITVAPVGTVDALKWFCDAASFGTDVVVWGADAGTGADDGYRIATGTASTTGTELTTGNHTGLDVAPVDVTSLTASASRTLAGSATGTGVFGDFFVYQMAIGAAAKPGSTPVNIFNWQFDET
jgi:hypothetical protein